MSEVETARMTSKGQLVIPQEIREEIGAKEGTTFAVYSQGDTVTLKKLSLASNLEDDRLKAESSKLLYRSAQESWTNRKGTLGEIVNPFNDFSGLRAIDVSMLPASTFLGMNFDTIGTKTEIAERLGKHDTIAYDLFAMVCDDAVVRGGEPVLIGSNLETNKIDIDLVRQLAIGYTNAAKEANVAIINGEIAVVGSRVSGYANPKSPCNYNWGATVVWFGKKEHLFSGNEVKAGDSLVAFEESGFRSNGFTLLRKIMKENWTKETLLAALTPSKIYCRGVVSMFGKLSGVAHISGGGIPEKLGRMLKPSGLGARLTSPFRPCQLMQEAIEIGKLSIEDAYHTWNMGNGMIVSSRDPDAILKLAKKSGINAKVCGEVTAHAGIELTSFDGQKLSF